MWKIILSGLVMLNAQPNDYSQSTEVHVLLVDARTVMVDSKGKPIAPHTAVLEIPVDCLDASTQPDWKADVAGIEQAFFLLEDASLTFQPSPPAAAFEIITGTRPMESNGDLRLLPCCVERKEDCRAYSDPDIKCADATYVFAQQRRDLSWVTPMEDLGSNGKLASGCLPTNLSNCPVVAWFTIDKGTVESYMLEGEKPGYTGLRYVRKTYLDGSEPARAAARKILWSLSGTSLEIEIKNAGGSRKIALQSVCSSPIQVRNEPIEHLLESHVVNNNMSQRHAEHLFRLLATPPATPKALTRYGSPTGSGLCPPGDSNGPDP